MTKYNGRNVRLYAKQKDIGLLGTVAVGTGLLGAGVLLIGAVFSIWFGILLLQAWVADAVYSNIWEGNGSAPDINFWPMVGLVFVFHAVFGGIFRRSKD